MVQTVKSPVKPELSKEQALEKENLEKARTKKLLKEITRKMNQENYKYRQEDDDSDEPEFADRIGLMKKL